MINGVKKLAIEKVTHSKSKGKKFVEELNAAMSPEKLATTKPENHPEKIV